MNLLEFVISSASSTGADLILWTALSSLVAKQKFIQMIKKSSNKERSRCEQRRRRWRGEIKFWTIWDEKQKGNLIAMSLYLPSQRCHFTCYLLLASLPPSTRNKNVWISLLRSRLRPRFFYHFRIHDEFLFFFCPSPLNFIIHCYRDVDWEVKFKFQYFKELVLVSY